MKISPASSEISQRSCHLKIGAKDGVSEAAGQIGSEATRVHNTLSAQGAYSAKAVGQQIRERPVIWLLAALAAGFAVGRILPR
jgi:hypothetical protein